MAFTMSEFKVRLTFTEELLATSPANQDIYRDYIGSKSPDASTIEDEVAALGVEAVAEKGMTIFPKLEDGTPFMYDYQIKGYFKDVCSMLRANKKTLSGKVKAYRKEIDGRIFIKERKIPIIFDGEIGNCERSLRASTPQGDITALANSETIPEGATVEFTIMLLIDDDYELVLEWLDYGKFRGTGQWRNSGKGKFTYEVIDALH